MSIDYYFLEYGLRPEILVIIKDVKKESDNLMFYTLFREKYNEINALKDKKRSKEIMIYLYDNG